MMSQSPQSPHQDNDFSPPWQPAWHGEQTQPFVVGGTSPIPSLHTPHYPPASQETRGQRFQRHMRVFFKAVLRRVYQLLALALIVLLLLLLARFTLHFFGITTSIFTSWIYFVTDAIVYPFNNLIAPIPYNGFSIDVTTIIAAIVWIAVFLIIRRLLRILFGK